jgi:hypothetical protein
MLSNPDGSASPSNGSGSIARFLGKFWVQLPHTQSGSAGTCATPPSLSRGCAIGPFFGTGSRTPDFQSATDTDEAAAGVPGTAALQSTAAPDKQYPDEATQESESAADSPVNLC